MLAGFSEEAIEEMDPARRSRLLWLIFAESLARQGQNPFLTKAGHAAIDVILFPRDLHPQPVKVG